MRVGPGRPRISISGAFRVIHGGQRVAFRHPRRGGTDFSSHGRPAATSPHGSKRNAPPGRLHFHAVPNIDAGAHNPRGHTESHLDAEFHTDADNDGNKRAHGNSDADANTHGITHEGPRPHHDPYPNADAHLDARPRSDRHTHADKDIDRRSHATARLTGAGPDYSTFIPSTSGGAGG